MRGRSIPGGNSFPFGDLDERTSKSRYGVAYVRALRGQAGVSSQETSLDEDGKSIDFDKRRRLTVDTFAQWHKELLDVFTP